MNIYLFILSIVSITIIIAIDQIKWRRKIVFKAIGNPNYFAMIVSGLWLLLAILNMKSFIKYEIINTSKDLEFDNLYSAIVQVLLGGNLLLKSFQNGAICQNGIYTQKGNYKWNRIIDYEWGVKEYIKAEEQDLEYYNLKFILDKPNKTNADKWFFGESNRKINMNIKLTDKETVESFLEEVISERV